MNAKTVKLTFLAPVHFGQGRLSSAGCGCDAGTIFSALYLEALRMGCADDLIEAARTGTLTLSDAFPYIGTTYYLPKPMAPLKVADEKNIEPIDSRVKKASKKLAFIPANEYQRFIEGKFDSISALKTFQTGIGKSQFQTKVNLRCENEDGDAEPYHVGSFRFAENAGAYFMVKGSYDLTPLLEQLQFSGIGGRRTSGYGRFSYAIESESPVEVADQDTPKSSVRILLATACPTEQELDDTLLQGARYKLVRRGGFVQSATYNPRLQKRRDLYFFAAGASFPHTFDGSVFDAGTSAGTHPVYRYARAMWMEV